MYNYNLLSLSSEEEKECFEQFAEGNDEARSMLIENNIRFVVHIANKYRDMKIEWEDLISMGNIGLIKGVDSFDPSKGKFSTYIGRCIENEILMGFRKEKRHFGVESLQKPVSEDIEGNHLTLEDIIPCKEENKADSNEDDSLEQVKAAFRILDDLEKSIITIYFQENHPSQDAIARSLGVTQSYLSRRMNSAINKIKSYLGRSKILEPKAFNHTIYDLFEEKTKEEVDELLSTLDDLEREIILLFFPLSVHEKGYTLSSIAKTFGFSEFGIYLKFKTITGKLNIKPITLERNKS